MQAYAKGLRHVIRFSPGYQPNGATTSRQRHAMGFPVTAGTAARCRAIRRSPDSACAPGANSRPGNTWPMTRPTGESTGEEAKPLRLDTDQAVRTTPVSSPQFRQDERSHKWDHKP